MRVLSIFVRMSTGPWLLVLAGLLGLWLLELVEVLDARALLSIKEDHLFLGLSEMLLWLCVAGVLCQMAQAFWRALSLVALLFLQRSHRPLQPAHKYWSMWTVTTVWPALLRMPARM